MSCPAEAYQLIMEKKRKNSAIVKTEETTKMRRCGEVGKEETTETTIIVRGNWEHIQEAVDNEYETKIEITHKCQDCRGNGETENGEETRNCATFGAFPYIVGKCPS